MTPLLIRLSAFSLLPKSLASLINQTRYVHKVVMVRHGQSEWNKLNLFTGWYDTSLSEEGAKEAEQAGEALKKDGYKFDIAFTSVLKRAIKTLRYILEKLHQTDLKTVKSWRLNERHYGSLTGKNKKETAEIYGENQVKIWRRSYDIPPPPMKEGHPYYSAIAEDPRYQHEPKKNEFPKAESLKQTLDRTLPFWKSKILPQIKAGKQVLIVAHGNSLRGIVKSLDDMSEKQIMETNLPTGIPFLYLLDNDFKPIKGGSMKFLGDPETVKKAIEVVSKQGKVK